MSDAELAKFHKLCEVSIIVEADGSNPVLCVSANVRDNSSGKYHNFKRCVALAPLMRMLTDKIRQYHTQLHIGSRLPGPTNPEGERHWRGLGTEYDPPRKQAFYEAPEYLDDAGLPPSDQIQGWLDSIKKTARHLAEAKAVKSLYSDLKTYGAKAEKYASKGATWAKSHQKELALAAALAIPGGGPAAAAALQTSFKVYDAVQAAKKKNPEALAALKKIKALAEKGDPKAQDAYKAAQLMNDMLNAKQQTPTKVAGWLYNRPYRTNAQTLIDAATGKFPTVSLALREGWHDGLAFAGSMKRKNFGLLGA